MRGRQENNTLRLRWNVKVSPWVINHNCLLGLNSLGRILAQHDVDPRAVLA